MKTIISKEDARCCPYFVNGSYQLNKLFDSDTESLNILTILQSDLTVKDKIEILFNHCNLTDVEKELLAFNILKTSLAFVENESSEFHAAKDYFEKYEKCKIGEYSLIDLKDEVIHFSYLLFENNYKRCKKLDKYTRSLIWGIIYFIRDEKYKRTTEGLCENVKTSIQEQELLSIMLDFCKEITNV